MRYTDDREWWIWNGQMKTRLWLLIKRYCSGISFEQQGKTKKIVGQDIVGSN
jgi:hypothetical protein